MRMRAPLLLQLLRRRAMAFIFGHGPAVLGGKILVFSYDKTVEVYDPATNSWSAAPPMHSTVNARPYVAVLGRKILRSRTSSRGNSFSRPSQ